MGMSGGERALAVVSILAMGMVIMDIMHWTSPNAPDTVPLEKMLDWGLLSLLFVGGLLAVSVQRFRSRPRLPMIALLTLSLVSFLMVGEITSGARMVFAASSLFLGFNLLISLLYAPSPVPAWLFLFIGFMTSLPVFLMVFRLNNLGGVDIAVTAFWASYIVSPFLWFEGVFLAKRDRALMPRTWGAAVALLLAIWTLVPLLSVMVMGFSSTSAAILP